MAEAITEMIIPGTYIEVRAEGLIGVTGIVTGNVGVVGTAARGPVGETTVLTSFADAVQTFGSYDAWIDGTSDELTLVRALQQVFGNGGSTVYCVRTAATGFGAGNLVRHLWVDEFAPRYADMWSYSDVSISLIRSFGGTQAIPQAQLLAGPAPDTGHTWFQLGLFSQLFCEASPNTDPAP